MCSEIDDQKFSVMYGSKQSHAKNVLEVSKYTNMLLL